MFLSDLDLDLATVDRPAVCARGRQRHWHVELQAQRISVLLRVAGDRDVAAEQVARSRQVAPAMASRTSLLRTGWPSSV